MTKRPSKAERTADASDAFKKLHEMLKPGDTVYCVLKHVSSSGMSRVIDFVIPYTRVDEYPESIAETQVKAKRPIAYHTHAPAGAAAGEYEPKVYHRGRLESVLYNDGKPESAILSYDDGETLTVPADTVRVVRQVSRPAVRSIAWLIAQISDYRQDDRGGLKVGGCGMDMGFSVVYNLGSAMWPKGTPKPHGRRNGEPDTAGGYALKSTWL